MITPTDEGYSLKVMGREMLWVMGVLFLITIGMDDGLLARIFRASMATFLLGTVISMRLKRLRPNWKAWFWTTYTIACLGGFVAVGLQLYSLLN